MDPTKQLYAQSLNYCVKKFNEIESHVFVDNKITINKEGNNFFIDGVDTLFKYTSFSWFYYMIENQTISFLSPKLWKDPFEKLFYDENLHFDSNYLNGCICFTYKRSKGEESLWKIFQSDDREPLVKAEFNIQNLFSQLSSMMKTIGLDASVYLTMVDYSFERKDIVKLANQKRKNGFQSLDDYLTCLSLKRIAFCNEYEIRFFLVSNNKDLDGDIKGFKYLPCIKRVNLQPLPFMMNEKKEKYYSQLQKIYHQGMKDWLINDKKIGQVYQSRLYDPLP